MTAVVEYYPSPGHIGNDLFLKDDIKDINEDSQAIEQIYSYWFGENINTWSKTYPLNTKLWFKVQEQVDREIKEKFEGLLIDAARPNSDLYQRWKKTDRGKLALIILLDQFSRNMYRGTAKMFEFDSLALSLALEITEDCTHIKSYSLPERLFIYLPLVHSENLVYTTKGADRLEQLASEVTQRDVRRRYATNARSARVHQQIIEMYGRYPHRNHLLGRQSTPEEEEYLKTARNGFVRSVQTIQCPSSSILMPPDTSSTYPSLKILVLHGFHQNSNSLKRSAKKLFRELKGIATFYFANAPLPYNPTGEVKEQLLAAFGDGNLPEISYQRQWWNASKDSKIYHHLDVSLHYLDKLFKSDGPFDGVFGFAQGAALGGILCGLQPFGNISFHFAILISGFASRAECHEHLMQPNAIKNISSLHIYGVNDVLITSDRTLKLAAAFENPIIVSHPGGHFTPNTWPTNNIKQFLLDQQQQLLHQSDGISSFGENLPQSLITFEEKLKATIKFHQKRIVTLLSAERKENKLPVILVGLSKPMDKSTLETIIDHINDHLLDDVMLLIWSKRTGFHNTEDSSSLFFRHWLLLYLKKSDEVLSSYLSIIPKYGSWADLKTLYVCASQMEGEYPDQKGLLDQLKSACVKMFADQLRQDHRTILKQPDELSNEKEEQMNIESQEWISNCAKEAPRISNNPKNINTVMAKDIARYMHPLSPTAMNNERQLKAEKGYAYLLYKRLISAVCQVLEKASPTFVNEQARSRNRKDRALRLTKEQREELLNAPPSTYITNPEPEPVVPCALEDLQPLFDHLTSNKSGPGDENQPVVFTRGTIMSGGRLDLCKQVVGPQGIQPLLNAMKNSDVVNRLLLGNNIVGLPGAQAISNYIRFNQDSHIDTWYIAGNNFDSECISLICNALVNDMKVKALWLKRNPILTSGVVHIAQMLRTNHYLQTLDLLNTGLLDEGCKILFDAFKVNRTLKHLYLDTNGLTVKSGRIIRLHFEENDNQLESLYLSCNAFGDGGTSEIAVGLKHDQHLKRLGLASNCIGPDGVRALVDALIAHPSLQQLNLGFMKATILLGGLDNVIGDEGAGEVSRLIRSNEYIRSIDLTFNGISQRGLMKLRDALRENRTLTTLKVLQFGQVHSEITKEEINMMLETNKIEWGRQVLSNIDGSSLTKADCLQKGQQLNEEINFPEHVMEIISYYRTH
ncbi:unnamed protein product [Rotaria sp. Silwood1]|nr:unnamed protein product [Rotaria sp. Silwood1]